MTPADFIAALRDPARASAVKSKIPASFTIAQAALESGWGKSELATRGFNLFGVKADAPWKGDILTMPTREFLQGAWVTVAARWRRYPDWLACLDDHAAFLMKNPRYHLAFLTTTPEAFAKAIAAAGYATDPAYAGKIIATINAHNLKELDQP
jgi:flagellum-specific peptidoglycan hydrolase FlgJ